MLVSYKYEFVRLSFCLYFGRLVSRSIIAHTVTFCHALIDSDELWSH